MAKESNLKYDKRVDEYIEDAEDFAKPILKHLRALVHSADSRITETIKWGFPSFEFKGPVCSMTGFKAHLAFGFWKESLIPGIEKYFPAEEKKAMNTFGRVQKRSDLPSDEVLIKFIKTAIKLNEDGIKVKRAASIDLSNQEIPSAFNTALEKNKKAKEAFEKMSPSHKKEYLEWIVDAKSEETRDRRIKQTIEWVSEGKSRHWKYAR
jgi:uncharacterized protein YdeI (YjbR/CyaY-like superfamily)